MGIPPLSPLGHQPPSFPGAYTTSAAQSFSAADPVAYQEFHQLCTQMLEVVQKQREIMVQQQQMMLTQSDMMKRQMQIMDNDAEARSVTQRISQRERRKVQMRQSRLQ